MCGVSGPSHGVVGNPIFETAINHMRLKHAGNMTDNIQAAIKHLTSHINSPIRRHRQNDDHPDFSSEPDLSPPKKVLDLTHSIQDHLSHQPLTNKVKESIFNIFGRKDPTATIRIYDARNLPTHIGPISTESFNQKLLKLKRQNGDSPKSSNDVQCNELFDASEDVVKFYDEVHGLNFNQLLGNEETGPLPIIGKAHVQGRAGTIFGLDNAYWDGSSMNCGDGRYFNPLTKDSVVAHELGHGIVQEWAGTGLDKNKGSPSGLEYSNESGGLNEFHADASAMATMHYKKRITDINARDMTFRIGEDLFKNDPDAALRDMLYPGTAYKNNPIFGDDPQEGYGDYRNWASQAAETDPHLSSAVGNKWYIETGLSLGVPFWTTMEKIRMISLKNSPPECTYPEFCNITINTAEKLFSDSDKVMQAVMNGWREVGVLY